MSNPHNRLANSQSPYLLQHANNPVNWFPWGDEALKKASEEDKLLIVSIGYSACHWCHVMEREVFEDDSAATLMNESYVSIKVDREERPDIDEIYMRALQLMTNQGGWPLNVVCLPDGKPIWGATYVPNDRWRKVLKELARMYDEEREKVESYASQLTQGIQQSQLIALKREALVFQETQADSVFENWRNSLDGAEGGAKRAPKFPMPVNLNYLLEYGAISRNQEALDHVNLSLKKMAYGGIYDQVGGGFARYSVDAYWKVPHFEKMLYDNAQLIQLYSKAYRNRQEPLYQKTVEESIDFLVREMRDPSGAFYSALDADSEGEEGKYYIWKQEELTRLIPDSDWALFSDYYNVNQKGLWEEGNYILLRAKDDEQIASEYGISLNELHLKRKAWKDLLLEAREKRIAPGLDDKALCSWNALAISGLCEAYQSFGKSEYLRYAEETAQWILESQTDQLGLLHAWRNGESHIQGLLEDYAFSIQAFLNLYQQTGKESYLRQSEKWLDYTILNFEDRNSGLFFTRPKEGEQLIARSLETTDNVIPSANSAMAHNLFRLGLLLGKSAYVEQARQNLAHLKDQALDYGESYANWARLGLYQAYPFYEIAIIGPQADQYYKNIMQQYLGNCLLSWSTEASELSLFAGRFKADKTLIYPCQEGTCKLPFQEVETFLQDFQSP